MNSSDVMGEVFRRRGVGEPCTRCSGLGVRMYSSTSTWRGGMGGSAMSRDVCDDCWGSGDSRYPWLDLRKLAKERRSMEAEECIRWLAGRAGTSIDLMRPAYQELLRVIDQQSRRRKLPEGLDPMVYRWAQEALGSVLRELLGIDPK